MSESHQLQLLQINSPRNAQFRNESTSGTNPSQMTELLFTLFARHTSVVENWENQGLS